MAGQFHYSVFLKEAIEYLNPKLNQNFIDCTLGDGGHTKEILERISPQGKVLGIDMDKRAIEVVQKRLNKFKNRLILVQDNFLNIKQITYDVGFSKISGILFDLGLSWGELGDQERGFSFLSEGPLDMRFDKRSELTASDIVNTYSQRDLENILKNYGEERYARGIARGIVNSRKENFIQTARDLVEIINQSVPKKYLHSRIHFATRTFQALRIEVNDELNNLKKVLPDAFELLEPGGRMVVISFHSLEDRIVKHYFKELAQGCICPHDFPKCVCNNKPKIKILTKKVIKPGESEIKQNPASRSAKLRAIEKL